MIPYQLTLEELPTFFPTSFTITNTLISSQLTFVAHLFLFPRNKGRFFLSLLLTHVLNWFLFPRNEDCVELSLEWSNLVRAPWHNALLGTDVPLLETLSFSAQTTQYTEETLDVKFVADAPRLQSLSLCFNSYNIHIPLLPWSQIRYLSLEAQVYTFASYLTEGILKMFHLFPNLESFTHRSLFPAYDGWMPPMLESMQENQAVIVLPRLHTLCVDTDHQFSPIMQALSLLKTPALKSMEVISESQKEQPLPLLALNEFLRRSTCHLYSLNLQISR